MPTLKLTTSLKAHGQTLTELNFREPTGRDMRRCGAFVETVTDPANPTKIVSRFNNEVGAAFISELAGIPTSSVDNMSAADFMAAIGIIGDFFGPAPAPGAPATSSTDTTMPPGSSAATGKSSG